MKIIQILKGSFIILYFLACLNNMYSQSSTITNPLNNEENVALIPKIIVTFDNDIDSSSIKKAFTLCESDTLAEAYEQTILVIPILVSKMDRDYWKWYARRGEYNLENNNTLSLNLDVPLEPNSQYVVVVSNLKLVNENNDTIPINENSCTFTTIDITHELLPSFLSYYPIVRCDDTLSFNFTRDISSATTPLGDIVEISILDSISNSSGTLTKCYSSVETNSWLDVFDNKKIMIKPTNNFETGAEYRVKVNTSYINGDRHSDRYFDFKVKDEYSISIIVDVESSTLTKPENVTWPPEGTTYHKLGTEIPIFTQKKYGDLIFDKWISNVEKYNNLQSPLIKINPSCEDISDIWLKAMYKEYDSISCAIANDDSLNIKVYDSDYNYLGNSGTYTIHKNDHILVQAYGINNNNHFSGWMSDEQIINSEEQGNTSKRKKDNVQNTAFNPINTVINVRNAGRDINMGPIADFDSNPKYKLTFSGGVDFSVLNGQNIEWETDYYAQNHLSLPVEMGLVQIFVNDVPLEQSEIEFQNNEPVTVKLKINPNFPRCPTGAGFNFVGYITRNDVKEFPIEEENFPTELVFTVEPSDDIYFEVRPWHDVTPEVNVTTEWEESENPDRIIGRDFYILAQIFVGNCTLGYQLLRDENGMDVDGLFCGANVNLFPLEIGSGVKFDQWSDELTYYHQNPGDHSNEIYDNPTTIILSDADKKAKARLLSVLSIEKIQFELDINKDYPSYERDALHPNTDHYIKTGENPAIKDFTILYNDLGLYDKGKNIVRDIESWDYDNDIETGYGAQIKFVLSDKNVNINDLYNNIWIEETPYKDADGLGVEGRVDGLGRKKIFFNSTNSTILIDPQTQDKIYVFNIPGAENDPDKALPKGQTFNLVFSKNIDQTGELQKDVYIQCRMQLPGIVSRITKCKAKATDLLYPNPEFVFPVASVVLGATPATIFNNEPLIYTEQYPFQYNYPDHSPWYIQGEVNKEKSLSPALIMYETSQMFIEDNVVEMFGLFDHDGKACNKSGKMKELVSQVITNLKPDYNSWSQKSYKLKNALEGLEPNPFKDPFDKIKDDITKYTKKYHWVGTGGWLLYNSLDSAAKAALKNLIPSWSEIVTFCDNIL